MSDGDEIEKQVDAALERLLLTKADLIAETVRNRADLRGKRYVATAAVQLLWPGQEDAAFLLELEDGGNAVVRAGSEPRGSDALTVGMLESQLVAHRAMLRRVERFLERARAEGLA